MRNNRWSLIIIAAIVVVSTACTGVKTPEVTILRAPTVAPSWVVTYGEEEAAAFQDGIVTLDGGYLFVGSNAYSHNNTDDEDMVMVKMDQDGVVLWEKTLGGTRFDRANRIISASDGNALVLGETRSEGAGDRDFYLVKLDPLGDKLWSQTFGGEGEEKSFDILLTTEGSILMTGQTRSFGAGGSDIYLVKADGDGQLEWARTYGSAQDEEGYVTCELPGEGYLILGAQLHEGWDYLSMNPDISLTAVDDGGNVVWSKTLEKVGVQSAFSMVGLEDDFLLAGLQSSSGDSADTNPLLQRIDVEGNVIWEGSLADEGTFNYASDVLAGETGIVITGLWSKAGSGGVLWMGMDAQGELLWQSVLEEQPGNVAGVRVLSLSGKGYLIIANIKMAGDQWYSLLIKTDDKGEVK